LAWISYVAPRSRQEMDGGEQEPPQLSGWNRPTRPRASSTRRLPDGVPPLAPVKVATKQALAPKQSGAAPRSRS
jgi:hypothetical protein